jgi:hypothetical protein
LANDTFQYDFVVVCGDHRTHFYDLTFAYDSHGTVTIERAKEIKVPPPPPPPPPPLKTKCKCVKMTLGVAPAVLAGQKLSPTGSNLGVSFKWTMTCSPGNTQISDCKGNVFFSPPTILAGSLPRPPNGLKLDIRARQFICKGPCNKSVTGSFQIQMSSKSQLNKLFGRTLAFTIKYGCPGAPLATFRVNVKISKTGVMS